MLQKQYDNIKETVNLMNEDLLFEPNTAYKYSTHAFNLIAAAIEGASGMSYAAYLKKEVFEPLSMENTWPEDISQLNGNDASLYYQKNGKLKKETVTNDSYKIPGASFRTTPEDLVRLMDAYANSFLSSKVVNQIFESNKLTNGTETQVGVAWRSSIDGFGYEVKEHAGSWRGARTVVVYYPKEELAVSLMTNTSCSLLIEEVAHVFAEISRTKEGTIEDSDNLNKKVLVKVINGKETIGYNGVIEFDDNEGSLTTDSKGFLQSSPIISLRNNSNYALVNPYGIIILDLKREPKLSGNGYMYYSMNKKSPKETEPYMSLIEE
ncbi:MAG: serine hydrolase domain-containing protein [Marinicellaceae bacterium]